MCSAFEKVIHKKIVPMIVFLILLPGAASALRITNLSVSPNPFSPNGDGLKDTTKIRFVLTDKTVEISRVVVIFDTDGDGMFDDEEENDVQVSTGELEYIWAGDAREGVHKFIVRALDEGGDILAESDGSVTIDTIAPVISNVNVSLSPFSPNGDGVADVTEISFNLTGTNPGGYVNNTIGDFAIADQRIVPAVHLPFGFRLRIVPLSISSELTFKIIGGYKGAIVEETVSMSPTSGTRIGTGLFDTISQIAVTLGLPEESDSIRLEWFTGNAVVNIHSSDGQLVQSLPVSPAYGGDSGASPYFVRWGSTSTPVAPGLDDGIYIYRILAEDGTGNMSQMSGEIILVNSEVKILSHSPSPPRISPNGDNQSDQCTITYELSKPAKVTLKILDPDGDLVDTLVSDVYKEAGVESEIWDGTDSERPEEAEMTYQYVITATDPLTADTVRVSGTIRVDTLPPSPPTVKSSASYTNRDSITITGIAEAGSTVSVFVGDTLAGRAELPDDTREFTLQNVPLSEGKNVITAIASDSVGNVSQKSSQLTIQLDKTPPVTIAETTTHTWQNKPVTIRLRAEDDDGGSGVLATYYTIDGSIPTTSSPSGNEITLTEDGVYLIRFFSQDNAGNVESVKQDSDYTRIDRTPPRLIMAKEFSSEDNAFFDNTPIVVINGEAWDHDEASGVRMIEAKILPHDGGEDEIGRITVNDGIPQTTIDTPALNGDHLHCDPIALTEPVTLSVSGFAGGQPVEEQIVLYPDRAGQVSLSGFDSVTDVTMTGGNDGDLISLKRVPSSDLENGSWLFVSGTTDWLYSFIPDVVLDNYRLYVRATDNAGNTSVAVATIRIEPPGSATHLTATPISGGRIRIAWDDPLGRYNIYRSSYSGFIPDDSVNLVASLRTGGVWIDDETTDQTEYYYRIGTSATDAAAGEEISAIADKTPPAIENISATPNSFSPNSDAVDDSTLIAFTLTEETFVTLRIYDSSGSVVRELVHRVLPAGDNLIEWDGRIQWQDRPDNGALVDEGVYVFRFEKASTIDSAGNALLQDISGTITCIRSSPLEVRELEAIPNPFSPNGDKINDAININYTLSDYADYVTVNIFDTSGGSSGEVIASLRAEAFEYYYDGVQWVAVHLTDGIPPGRSDVNYYLKPVDPKNPAPPPFSTLDRPDDALTIEGYLAAYQAYNPNWKPVPFTIQWFGQGATDSGAYVYQVMAAKSSGISSVGKTGVILLEGLEVVPDDKTPPTVKRTYPQADTVHSARIEFVSADLDDSHGTGVDLTASTIRLIGPNGVVPGRQSNDGSDTITWTLTNPLADDGRDDGIYTISVLPVDKSKNRAISPLLFVFEYDASVNDRAKPEVSDATVLMASNSGSYELSLDEEIVIEPINGNGIEQFQVNISDIGSGIDLSASSLTLIDTHSGTSITAEKKETPVDRFNGKLILRNISSLQDGRYKLRVQPWDNAGNPGNTVEFLFRYKTVDDNRPPTIHTDTVAVGFAEGGEAVISNGDFIGRPVSWVMVKVTDEAPSSGINLNPGFTSISLEDESGTTIPATVSYVEQLVTQSGVFGATVRLDLNEPLQTGGADDSRYTLRIKATDNSDNATPPVSVEFVYDTISPSVDRITPQSESTLKAIPTITVEMRDNPSGSGIAADESLITLIGPDGNRLPISREVSETDGMVTISVTTDITVPDDGRYQLLVTPVDRSGNRGETAITAFRIDTMPPQLVSMIPVSGSSINGIVDQLQLAFSDASGLNSEYPATKIDLKYADGSLITGKLTPNDDSDGAFSLMFPVPLSVNGVYQIHGQVTDNAGNTTLLAELDPPISFVFDNVPPSIAEITVTRSGTGITQAITDGTIIDGTISAVTVNLHDETSGIDATTTKVFLADSSGTIVPGFLDQSGDDFSWQIKDPGDLEPGVYLIRIDASDRAKNTTQLNLKVGIGDTTELKPQLIAVTPPDGAHINTSIERVIALVKDRSGTGIDFTRSSIAVTGAGVSDRDRQENNGVDQLVWVFATPTATDHSDDGVYHVTIQITDRSGNTRVEETSFVIDTVPPTVKTGSPPLVTPRDGSIINTPIDSVSVVLQDTSDIDLSNSTVRLRGPSGFITARQTHNGVDTIRLEFAPLSIDGEYTIECSPVDKAGNAAPFPLRFSFVLDTTAPRVLSVTPLNGSTVSSPIETIEIALEDEGAGIDFANTNVKLIRAADGQILKSQPTEIGSGKIQVTFDPLKSDGSDNGLYRIEILPVDKLGNRADIPVVSEFTYLIAGPILTSQSPKADALLTTPIERVVVSLADQSGQGIDYDNSRISLTKLWTGSSSLGIPVPGTQISSPGALIFVPDKPFATDERDNGRYLVEVTAIDRTGASTEYSYVFTYDTQPPSVVSTYPADGQSIRGALDRVSAELNDLFAGVDLTTSSITLKGPGGVVPGKQADDGQNTLYFTFDPIAQDGSEDGKYTILISPADTAGNTAVELRTSTFTVDNVAPIVIESVPSDGAVIVSPINEVKVTLSDGNGSGVAIEKSTISVFRKIGTELIPIAGRQTAASANELVFLFERFLSVDEADEGQYLIQVIASDLAGNETVNPITISFTYDVNAPILVSTNPEPGSVITSPISAISAKLEDRSGLGLDISASDITLTHNGEEIGGTIQREGDVLTLVLSNLFATDGSDDGRYSINVHAVDLSGSEANYMVTFTYDTSPPAVTLITPEEGQALRQGITEISARLRDELSQIDLNNSSISLNGPSGRIEGVFYHDGKDTIGLKFPRTDRDGEYTIEITPADKAGNKSQLPVVSTFLIDSTPPKVAVTPADGSVITIPIGEIRVDLADEETGVDPAKTEIEVRSESGALDGELIRDDAGVRFLLASPIDKDGEYRIAVTAADLIGNSVAVDVTFTFAGENPIEFTITPAADAVIKDSIDRITAVLTAKGEESIDIENSAMTVAGPGVQTGDKLTRNKKELIWRFATPLATDGSDDGKYMILLSGRTNSGLVSSSESSFVYDTSPPIVTETSPKDGDVIAAKISRIEISLSDSTVIPDVSGVDLERTSVTLQGPSGRIKVDRSNNGRDKVFLDLPADIGDGKYSLLIKPADLAGNTDVLGTTVSFTVDTTPPAVSATEPQANSTVVSPFNEIVVHLKDEGAGVDVEGTAISLTGPKGILQGTIEARSEDILAYVLTDPPASDGTDDGLYTIMITPADKVGNESPQSISVSFNYATRAPSIVSSSPVNGAFVRSAVGEIIVQLRDNSGSGLDLQRSSLSLTDAAGTEIPGQIERDEATGKMILKLFSPIASSPDSDGEYRVTIIAADGSGGTVQYRQAFRMDTRPPIVTRASALSADGREYDFDGDSSLELADSIAEFRFQLIDEGSGVDLDGSTITVMNEKGKLSGVLSNNGVDTLFYRFTPLRTDGSEDGAYQIRIKPKDRLGNAPVTETVYSLIFDTTGPTILTSSPSDGSSVVSSIDSVTVTLFDDGTGVDLESSEAMLIGPDGVIETRKQTGTDTLIISFPALPADVSARGEYRVEISAVDNLGNTSTLTTRFMYEPSAPILKEISPGRDEAINQSPAEIKVVLQAQAGLNVDMANSTIELLNPDNLPLAGDIIKEGLNTLRFVPSRLLATDGTADGWYTVKITAIDERGNRAVYTTRFLYDTTPPEISWVQPEDGQVLNSAIEEVSAFLSDEHAGIDLTRSAITISGVKGKQQNDGSNTIKLRFSSLDQDGVYEIKILPKDILGNAPPEAFTYRFRIDRTPPTVVSTEPADRETVMNVLFSRIVVRLDDGFGSGIDPGATEIFLEGPNGAVNGKSKTGNGQILFLLDDPLPMDGSADGEYLISVIPADVAGNKGDKYQANFTYDTIQASGPKLNRLSALPAAFSPNGDGSADIVTISFDLSKDAVVTGEIYSANGDLVYTLTDHTEMTAGSHELIWTGLNDSGIALPDATYTVRFDSIDSNGQTGAIQTLNIKLDNRSPIVQGVTVVNNPFTPDGDGDRDNTRIRFSVSNSEPSDSVSVEIIADDLSRVAVLRVEPNFIGDGDYSANWDGTGATRDGKYTYRIRVSDAAGNARETDGVIILDKAAPSVQIVSPQNGSSLSRSPIVFEGTAFDYSGIIAVETTLIGGNDADPVWTDAMFSGDNVDNDGDGRIDEELPNDQDDDGDGGIDEDLAAPESDSAPVIWSVTDYPKKDGEYVFHVRVTDSLGHRTSPEHTSITFNYDTHPPVHIESGIFRQGQLLSESPKFRNGSTIEILTRWDAPGYQVTADFSSVDNRQSTALVATDNSDGSYLIRHEISTQNTAPDGLKMVRITATDGSGQSTETEISVRLNNTPPRVVSVTSDKPSYRNGDLINMTVTCDSIGYSVKADFSPIDSNYRADAEIITDLGDGRYRVKYRITSENERADILAIPIEITVFDGFVETIDRSYSIGLDNSPPEIKLISPLSGQASTNTRIVEIMGVTEPRGGIDLHPEPDESSYDIDTGVFSFIVSLNPGTNDLTITARDAAGNESTRIVRIVYYPIESAFISAAMGGTLLLDGVDGFADTIITIPPKVLPADLVVSINVADTEIPTQNEPTILDQVQTPIVAYRIRLTDPDGREAHVSLRRPILMNLAMKPDTEIAANIAVYHWDGVHWNRLGGTMDSNGVVTVRTTELSGLFALFPERQPSGETKLIAVRPNPFTPNGDGINDGVGIYFDNPEMIPPIVRIYDIRGRLHREIDETGYFSATWDGTDNDGRLMEPGIYIFQVQIGNKKLGGSIVIAR